MVFGLLLFGIFKFGHAKSLIVSVDWSGFSFFLCFALSGLTSILYWDILVGPKSK